MSDPSVEPGAPSGDTNVPSASEKSVASEVKQRVPNQLVALASTPDRIILRLNKLLASPGGLASFLSTLNYSLYLLAYLTARSAPLQMRLASLLAKITSRPVAPASAALASTAAATASISSLGALLSSTRTTLRLFGLFPMYAWMRSLLAGPKPGQDQVLYATSVTQCSLYMTFQFLENVGLLTDHAVLPTSYTQRYLVASPPTGTKPTAKIYLWAYRAWFAGVLCDVVRLAREAQLQRARKESGELQASEAEKEDAKWWADAVVPAAWTPVALQFSTEGGTSWFNLGIMGFCGMVAGLGKTRALWEATADA